MELIKTDNSLSLEAERKIIAFKESIEKIKQQQEEFNNSLLEEMKKRGIISYKDENMSISLIAEGTQEKFDTKTFKAKFPDIYKKFTKETKRKEYARVSIKKGITSKSMIEDVNPDVQAIGLDTNGQETF